MPDKTTKKILCILQLPPPVHGAALLHTFVVDSKLLNQIYAISTINLQFASSIADIQKFSIRKVFKALYYAVRIPISIISNRPALVYYSLSPFGYAFYRDAFYLTIIKMLGVKIVVHLHGKGIADHDKTLINRFLYRNVMRKTAVICGSENLSKDILNVYKATPYIVPNGIPLVETVTYHQKIGTGAIPNILYLSNYVKGKGVLTLIHALAIVKRSGRSFSARLVGAPGGLSIDDLKKEINNHDLEGIVEVTGPIYGEDKLREFQKADIFVFPTFYKNEAFPLVILEAMQHELPVISTFECSIPEIIENNKSGLLVEGNDPEALASKIEILLDDDDYRVRLAINAALRFKDNFTLGHFETNVSKVWREEIARN